MVARPLARAIAAAWILANLVSTSAAGEAAGPETRRQGAFSWSEEKDAATGWTIWTLRHDNPDDATRSQAVRICPEGGANLFSYIFGGVELLHQPNEIKALRGGGAGIPILYPTPNRVRDGRFTFEGREFRFSDTGKTTIHGLVLKLGWQSDPPRFVDPESARGPGVAVRTWIAFEPGQLPHDRFPLRHRLEVDYTLMADGVSVRFAVVNRDTQRIPFGFALHPYFRILGAREKTTIRVPANRRMEATPDLLPTGQLLPIGKELQGPEDDRENPSGLNKPLSELALDDVFWGMETARPAEYVAEDAGIRVRLPTSSHFTHMVVYTPKGRPFFCLENQTCSTDAHNLHAKGLEKEAHLLVVEPGKTLGGEVCIRPSRIAPAADTAPGK